MCVAVRLFPLYIRVYPVSTIRKEKRKKGSERETKKRVKKKGEREGRGSIDDNDPVDDSSLVIIRVSSVKRKRKDVPIKRCKRKRKKKKGRESGIRGAFVF